MDARRPDVTDERPFALVLALVVLFGASALVGAMVVSDGVAFAPSDGDVLVPGRTYVTRKGTVCVGDAPAESYPPSIDVTRSLRMEGLDPGSLPGARRAGGVSWTDTAVQVRGTVAGGALLVGG